MTTERQPMCDDDILRLLADQRGRSIAEIAAHFHVTLTAIRKRLIRLMHAQAVTRQRGHGEWGRGQPQYLYYIAAPES